jgi:hypothetical protein
MAIAIIDLATPSGLKLYENTDLDEVKAGITAASTVVHSIDIDNGNGAEVFVKLFNVAVGSVTVGTTPAQVVIMVPASTRLVLPIPGGWTFGTALTAVCLLNAIESDSTNPGATAVELRLIYV